MDIALNHITHGEIFSGMARLVSELADIRRRLSHTDWLCFAKTQVLTHGVRSVVHEDPLTYRAFSKPRGYAGDAVMMDYIYGYGPVETDGLSAMAQGLFGFTAQSAASAAVRFRRRVLAEAIDSEAARVGRPIDVVALAAGHLREVDLSTAVRTGAASVTALDQDEESLALVHREYAKHGVQAVPTSVRHILGGRTRLPASDLSYTAGLYDYLTEPVATRLTSLMFEALRPGGSLLLANFLPNIHDVGYMESLMDWQLIYRDDAEMRALADGIPCGEIASIEQFHDPFDNITFMKVSKAGGGLACRNRHLASVS